MLTNPEHDAGRWFRVFRRIETWFVYAGGALPLLWLIAFYSFIVCVRLSAGVWPDSSAVFDRHSFHFYFHELLVTSGTFFLPIFFVSWIVASSGFALTFPKAVSLRRFFILLIPWCVIVALVFIDPASFMDWYFFHS
jgi:hypothetical protein